MNELFVSRPPEDNVVVNDCNVEESLQVLQALTSHGDPLMSMQHYYQKHRYLQPLADCWLPPTWYRIGKGKESTTFWRCSFQCPLKNTLSSSVVPLALLQPPQPDNPTFQQLLQLHQQWFGDFVVSPKDGLIYIGTKKNAKRSAALFHLYRLFGPEGLPINFFQTKNTDPFFQSSTVPTIPISDPQALTKRRKKLSQISWIHPLHAAGVRKVLIRYQAVHPDPCAPLSPTRVVCQLELRNPISTTVESDPMPTKAKAREDAITKLLEQIPPVSQDLPTTPDKDGAVETGEKEQLLLCDSVYLDCRLQLPNWTRWNASQSSSSSTEALLYSVVILPSPSDSGSLSITDLLGITPNEMTRLGLVLPLCQELVDNDTIFTFEASFQFRNSNSSNHIVHLADSQRISLERSDQLLLEDFYSICSCWKAYGNGTPMETLRSNASTRGRHYMFVPLTTEENHVDWDLIQNVLSNRTEPYLVATRRYDLPLLQSCSLMLIVALVVRYCKEELMDQHAILGIGLLATLSCYALLLFCFPQYAYVTHEASLTNHFLRSRIRPNIPFIPTSEPLTQLTALSNTPISASTTDHSNRRRFVDLMRQRHKIRLLHPSVNLVEAHPANKIADFNRLEVETPTQAAKLFLMPELMQILPMPRDFLFVVGAAEKFMMPLEIVIHEHFKARQWQRAVAQVGSEILQESFRPPDVSSFMTDPLLVDAIREATTVFPTSRFERLEFLGDRVLNHMISLNLFFRNNQLQWAHDDFRDLYSMAKKNVELIDAALRVGLDRMIHAGVIPWKEEATTLIIPDTFLCNITESILGAAYYGEWKERRNGGAGRLTVGLLERLNLPLPKDPSHTYSQWWPPESCICWMDGYDFARHPEWHQRLDEAAHAFDDVPLVKNTLDIKVNRLLTILLNNFGRDDRDDMESRLAGPCPRLLMSIALFDAGLDGSDSLLTRSEDCERLEIAGMIRDCLFQIGSTTLELEMSRDFYLLYPTSTPGDLHLLLTCALTHDVLGYIFMKIGFDQCMFDENPSNIQKTRDTIVRADALGEVTWKQNNGWILPGGLDSFHKRLQAFNQLLFTSRPGYVNICPRYYGLAAGRFCGSKKKSKISTIDDWQFSFKCIVGCLVLCIGTEPAWNIVRPLFAEVMLITPDEYRSNFAGVSSICDSYRRGNTNCVET